MADMFPNADTLAELLKFSVRRPAAVVRLVIIIGRILVERAPNNAARFSKPPLSR